MKKTILIIIGLALLVGGGWLLFSSKSRGNQGYAVLKIDSNPTAEVLFDNQSLGKTPFEGNVKSGEHTIKLVPESTVPDTIAWETKITLNASLVTYINRDLGKSELTSAGEILSLEKISGKTAEIAVISTPDQATATMEGKDKGTTPLVINDENPGNYELTVSLAGYKSRTVKIKNTSGYKLSAVFQLASLSDENISASPSPSESPKSSAKTSPKASVKASASASASATAKPKATPPAPPYVEILDTPTGYLNVRKEASTTAEILTKIYPGEFYSFVEESNGWFKIKYEGEKTGWISSQYAKKTE